MLENNLTEETKPLVKDFVFDKCPSCKQTFTRLYYQYKNWEDKKVFCNKSIDVCTNKDCTLGVDLEKLGHWKIKPNDYVFPVCSERAIRGIYPEDFERLQIRKKKNNKPLDKNLGKE